jgi:hypothetical protein
MCGGLFQLKEAVMPRIMEKEKPVTEATGKVVNLEQLQIFFEQFVELVLIKIEEFRAKLQYFPIVEQFPVLLIERGLFEDDVVVSLDK